MKLLTIIIPAYNETRTISKLLTKIFNLNIKKQVIVIDDNSSDDTKDKILKFKKKIDKIIFHKKNLGKGSAIKSAQKFVKGDYVIIQDADLEYNPKDILIMLKMRPTADLHEARRASRTQRDPLCTIPYTQ